MGYYTYHTLQIRGMTTEEEYEKLMDTLDNMCLLNDVFMGDSFLPTSTVQELQPYEGAKWYDHEADMLELSRLFPNLTFKLHGEGETADDIWDDYYKNGDHEECMAIVFVPKPKRIKWGDDSM